MRKLEDQKTIKRIVNSNTLTMYYAHPFVRINIK